jgi:hypothetical protein
MSKLALASSAITKRPNSAPDKRISPPRASDIRRRQQLISPPVLDFESAAQQPSDYGAPVQQAPTYFIYLL